MIFENVKNLSIPEGEVVKITYGDIVLWERAGLPSAYQQVEYLQTDGNQYINTGVLASNYPEGIRYVFKGNLTKIQNTSNIYWFGSLASGCRSGNPFTLSNNFGVFLGGSGGNYYYMTKPATGIDFELVVQGTPKAANSALVTFNGTKLNPNVANGLVNSEMPNANIYFLTAYGTGALNTANQKFYGKIYSFTMDKIDGTPIRNFVPCYRKSDNVIGLYDTVGRVFYTNIGSGSFTKGANV